MNIRSPPLGAEIFNLNLTETYWANSPPNIIEIHCKTRCIAPGGIQKLHFEGQCNFRTDSHCFEGKISYHPNTVHYHLLSNFYAMSMPQSDVSKMLTKQYGFLRLRFFQSPAATASFNFFRPYFKNEWVHFLIRCLQLILSDVWLIVGYFLSLNFYSLNVRNFAVEYDWNCKMSENVQNLGLFWKSRWVFQNR